MTRRRWLMLLGAIALVGLAAGVWLKRDSLRGAVTDARRVTGGNVAELRCVFGDRAQRVTYLSPDSIALVADLYEPSVAGDAPAIVLLHGSYPAGRRHPFVRVLAERFRRKGYVVLAPDARAYGESADPPDLTMPESFDFPLDVIAAIDFLLTVDGVDPERIHLLGHSFGGGVAMAAESRDPRIAKVVLKGPSRRLGERVFDDDAPDRDYFMARWANDMRIPGPLDFELWSGVRNYRDLGEYLHRFTEPGHAPLFLIDAADEDPRDLAWLRQVHAGLSPEVEYWTVPDTHHYLSVGIVLRNPCHRAEPVRRFVERVDEWLREDG